MQHNLSENTLSQFNGSERWYRHPLARHITYTDGVQHVAEEGGAYWLLDSIVTKQTMPIFKEHEVQFWELKVNEDETALLTCEDGEKKVFYTETIKYTDFPIKGIRIWLTNNVMLLPSEW